jgi:hypothetical protein
MWIILEDFLAGGVRREKVEDVFDADAQLADTPGAHRIDRGAW